MYACRKTTSVDYKRMYLDVDERGVAHSAYDDSKHAFGDRMAMGNMDFANASIMQENERKEFQSECWTLVIPCKRSGESYCGERDDGLFDGTATGIFMLYTNTRNQAARILDALTRIAPPYPDGTPKIGKLR